MSCLIVVDVQNDLCEKGALEVPKANEIIDGINREVASCKYTKVIFTTIAHPANHISFDVSNPGQEPLKPFIDPVTGSKKIVWPSHCIQGSQGAGFHPLLRVPANSTIITKGQAQGDDSYSAFGEKGLTDTGLEAMLRQLKVQHVFVVGLSLDYSVMQTAFSSLRCGFMTTILEDLTRGFNRESCEKLKVQFVKAGGLISHSH